MGSLSDADSFLSHKLTHIVIGGGTAGLVVAARLSEDPTITVGVLEAGPAAFDEPRINVPGRLGETLGTEYDWQFETTPQAALNGRKIPFNRGKVLGGSSALNFMMWHRGNKEDYDTWEKLGNHGWGWDGMLPYFKKSENFQAPDQAYQERHKIHFDLETHGTGGPLHTIYSSEYGASQQYWDETLAKLGVESCRSHSSGSTVGSFTALAGVDPTTQERCYSARAYYLPISHRKNLVLLTEANVGNIMLENESERDQWIATGVRFAHKDREYTAHASGEIIVCAGTIQSPQILELSGVGNPEVLKDASIMVKVANPNVGENLQDHMMTMMIYELDPSVVTPEALRANPHLAAAADEQYRKSKTGPRTAVGYSAAYLPFGLYTSEEEISRLAAQLPSTDSATARQRDQLLSERLSSSKQSGQIEFLFDVSNYSSYFASEPGKRYGTMMQMLQYPFSVGNVHIPPSESPGTKPTTSDDKPLINPRFCEGPGGQVDWLTMAAAQRFGHKICSTSPLSNIIVKRVFPPLKDGDDPATEDFASWVCDTVIADWHPVGTCAMGGNEGIEGGVVDDRLRVYGIKGLRVCDASIMPLQIAAHLQATVYAIGEKGAEMIKEDWRKGGNEI